MADSVPFEEEVEDRFVLGCCLSVADSVPFEEEVEDWFVLVQNDSAPFMKRSGPNWHKLPESTAVSAMDTKFVGSFFGAETRLTSITDFVVLL